MSKQPPTPKQRIMKVRPRPVPALPKKDVQEFGLARAGIAVCPECKCVFYKKSWHPASYRSRLPEGPVRSQICQADQWKKERRYEGQVVISLSSPAPEILKDILNTVHNSDTQAQERDPMDRVLWIDNSGKEIKVHTSENQLAVRIGKKLETSFRGSKLEIRHSKGEDVIRVYWSH